MRLDGGHWKPRAGYKPGAARGSAASLQRRGNPPRAPEQPARRLMTPQPCLPTELWRAGAPEEAQQALAGEAQS